MRTDQFDFELPTELIAQTPLSRGDSRLLILHRNTGAIEHRHFRDLPLFLNPADLLVLNDTRVSARRVRAVRANGRDAEVLLLRPTGLRGWDALVRPGRAFRPGQTISLLGPDESQLEARITGVTADGGRVLELPTAAARDILARWGAAPLPPYIHVPLPVEQEERYQTVYATHAGSAAAPTAGLHFTSSMLYELEAQSIQIARVTLNIGVGTFRPVRTDFPHEHVMHSETAEITNDAAKQINAARGRIVAIGTTTVRTLESAAQTNADSVSTVRVMAFKGETSLFITPGYQFTVVDALITNFHQPRSTLLMLVSAFAGIDAVRNAYRAAIENRYRFFSFGDAMLII